METETGPSSSRSASEPRALDAPARPPPEQPELRLAYHPISCAIPLLHAQTRGIFARHGLDVTLLPVDAWSGAKNLLVYGHIDASHLPVPAALAIREGIDGKRADIRLACLLNVNGQALLLSRRHAGLEDPRDLRGCTFGVPYRFAIQYYLLASFLASYGLDPTRDVKIIEVAPPRMAWALAKGQVDGVFAPEPFAQLVVSRGAGLLYRRSKDLWSGHPCCGLATTGEFVERHPRTYDALRRSVLEAELSLHRASAETRREIATDLCETGLLRHLDPDPVARALVGEYVDASGEERIDPEHLDFHPVPRREHGLWILAQQRRWGQLSRHVNPEAVMDACFDPETEAIARAMGFEMGEASPPPDAPTGDTGASCAVHEAPAVENPLSTAERIERLQKTLAAVAGGIDTAELRSGAEDGLGVLEGLVDDLLRGRRFARDGAREQHEERERQRAQRIAEVEEGRREAERAADAARLAKWQAEELNSSLEDETARANHLAAHAEMAHQETAAERIRLQTMFDSAQVCLLLVSESLEITHANDAFCRLVDKEWEEIIEERPGDALGCYDNCRSGVACTEGAACQECSFCEIILDVLQNGAVIRDFETKHALLLGGSPVDREFSINAAPVDDGEEKQVLLAFTDVTERKRNEAELRRAEARYRELFEGSRDALATLAPPVWTFVSSNSAARELFKVEDPGEFTTFRLWDFSPAAQGDGGSSLDTAREMIRIAMEEGSHFFEWTCQRMGGEPFPATILLTRIRNEDGDFLQATIRDITAQKNLEMELQQAQKLEAVGTLAAGIAHEINTPIQFVGDNLRFLRESVEQLLELCGRHLALVEKSKEGEIPAAMWKETAEALEDFDFEFLSEELPDAVSQSLEGAQRVAKIVRAMKEFSHPGSSEISPADLNDAIQTTITVARNEWKFVAEMETELDGELPPVPCIVGEFNQVILNMIVNARDAIGDVAAERGGGLGKIRITTGVEGEHAVITVGDTGGGIPDEVISRVFDPFFTTKEVGKGTGQGLAISRSVVVDKLGGILDVESEPGVGTTFTIRLPLTRDPAAQAA